MTGAGGTHSLRRLPDRTQQFLNLACLFVCLFLCAHLLSLYTLEPPHSPFSMLPFRTVITALMKAAVDAHVSLVRETGDTEKVKTAVQRELETSVN